MKRQITAVLLLLASLAAAPAGAVSIEAVTSPGGITAWLVEDHSNPIIALDFSIAVGSASDPADKTGLAAMVTGLLDEGAGDLDSQAFQGQVADLAMTLSFAADQDRVSGQLKTLTENRDAALRLLGLALSAPRFDLDAVERVRGQMLSALQQEEQEPQAVAARAFAAALFGDHPYGRSSSSETIKAITQDDLTGWIPSHLSRQALQVAVVGDITPEQLAPLLDAVFGALPARQTLPDIPEIAPPIGGSLSVIRRPIPQSVVSFGELGLKRDDPDWYNGYVMNYILGGGGFSSRLMTEVRVKRGLAYGVGTSLVPYRHAALFEGEVATRNDKVFASLDLIKTEFRRMAASGATAGELSAAKTYLNGAFPLQLSSTSAIATLLLAVQRDHLGIDYIDRRASLINRVGAADVQRVAQRLLHPEALTVVVIGDPPAAPE